MERRNCDLAVGKWFLWLQVCRPLAVFRCAINYTNPLFWMQPHPYAHHIVWNYLCVFLCVVTHLLDLGSNIY